MPTAAPTPAPTPSPTPAPVKAARVEIIQTGLLFTEVGQTRQLAARVFDDSGVVIDVPVRWSSTDPVDIAVSDSGLASAESTNGSTQIFAQVGELRSPPLLAVVTEVPAGAILVADEQIVRGPVETDPDAPPSLDNTYTVILAGPDAPPLDSLLIGTGSQPVAGRVVNTELADGGVLVTLQLVPAPELFPTLEINQVIDLKDVPVEIPAEIAEDFEVVREGSRFIFTSRPDSATGKAGKVAVPFGTRALQRYCETASPTFSGESPPIKFDKPLVFDLDIKPSVDVLYTPSRGLERFIVNAEPTFRLEAEPKLVLALEGKITCKIELFPITIPIFGALSYIVGGVIPVGIGAELAGKLTVADASIGVKTRVSNTLRAGLECGAGSCDVVSEFGEFVVTNDVTYNAPGLDDLRFEPAFELFGYAEASLGSPFARSLRFSALEAKLGGKLSGNFALQISQMLAEDYKSSYVLKIAAGIKAGDDVTGLLKFLGFESLGEDGLSIGTEIANSPTGTLFADRDAFEAGDDIRFTVSLDPVKSEFLGTYNVKEVLIVERRSDTNAVIVDRRSANEGDQVFEFDFTASESGATDRFFAFVVTRLAPLDLLSLEIDRARPALPVVYDGGLLEMGAVAFACAVEDEAMGCPEQVEDKQRQELGADVTGAALAASATQAARRGTAVAQSGGELSAAVSGSALTVRVACEAGGMTSTPDAELFSTTASADAAAFFTVNGTGLLSYTIAASGDVSIAETSSNQSSVSSVGSATGTASGENRLLYFLRRGTPESSETGATSGLIGAGSYAVRSKCNQSGRTGANSQSFIGADSVNNSAESAVSIIIGPAP